MHKNLHYDTDSPYRYRVALDGQIPIKMPYPVFNKVFKQDPFFNPQLFIYNGSKKGGDYRLILRNFGIINDTALTDRVPQEITTLKIDKDLDISQVLKSIAVTRPLVTPFQLTENNAAYYEPAFDRKSDCFFVYVGDILENSLEKIENLLKADYGISKRDSCYSRMTRRPFL